jgi:hypothetical protein
MAVMDELDVLLMHEKLESVDLVALSEIAGIKLNLPNQEIGGPQVQTGTTVISIKRKKVLNQNDQTVTEEYVPNFTIPEPSQSSFEQAQNKITNAVPGGSVLGGIVDGVFAATSLVTGRSEEEEPFRIVLNREIRHNFGHTIANRFREWYEPDYFELVKAVAERLEIRPKEHHSVADIEDKIIIEMIELLKAKVIKEKGIAAWDQVEKDSVDEVQRLLQNGGLSTELTNKISELTRASMVTTALAG